jgi:hypothetical protein
MSKKERGLTKVPNAWDVGSVGNMKCHIVRWLLDSNVGHWRNEYLHYHLG